MKINSQPTVSWLSISLLLLGLFCQYYLLMGVGGVVVTGLYKMTVY